MTLHFKPRSPAEQETPRDLTDDIIAAQFHEHEAHEAVVDYEKERLKLLGIRDALGLDAKPGHQEMLDDLIDQLGENAAEARGDEAYWTEIVDILKTKSAR